MKASELRMGNYVYFEHDKENLELLKFDFDMGWNMDYIKPIPLTEEWLIKFGYMFNNCYYLKDDSDIEFFKSNGKLFCEFYGNWFSNIEYVHDLQNLHFAIYKEELKIKQL